MNEVQRQNLLKELDRLLERVKGAEFDAVDAVRSAVKRWDLQGDIPHAAELREWGIDPGSLLSTPAATTSPPAAKPAISEDELERILSALRQRIRVDDPDADKQRQALRALRTWRDSGRREPLPYAKKLKAWGIWPPAESMPTPPPESAATSIDTALESEYQTARSLIQAHPYQAIKKLDSLRSRASGELAEKIAADLAEARVELERRTRALVLAAQRVQQEQPRNLDAQAEAWRAVTSLNPESLEAQEALQNLQLRVWQRIEDEIRTIREEAQTAASRNHLPDLRDARAKSEVLAKRADLPEDLREKAQALHTQVLDLLNETRERLGVVITTYASGELREAYRLAYKEFESAPKITDTAGTFGKAGEEIDAHVFRTKVAEGFLSGTKDNVVGRLEQAETAVRVGDPDTALEHLNEARGWLTDEVWTSDHRKTLQPQLEEVEREIKKVERLLRSFQEAQKKVTRARAPGVPARERLQLLNEAQQLYPRYPQIQDYLDDARDNLAGELAGELEAQIVEANRLMHQEHFSEALALLKESRAAALRDVPKPKSDSRLESALKRVGEAETAITRDEAALQNLTERLDTVNAKLDDYDKNKRALSLKEAKALLDQVPAELQDHPLTQAARSRLAVLQSDPESYEAGLKAYQSEDWAGASNYFDKVTGEFQQYDLAQQYSRRARAASAVKDARQAEEDGKWNLAFTLYRQAFSLFQEAGGDDVWTDGLMEKCREAKERIERNNRELRGPLEEAQKLLRQAQQSVPPAGSPLRDRLDPIPEFKAIIQKLEPLTEKPSILGQEIRQTLHQAHEAWRKAYLDALREAVEEDWGERLSEMAYQRAGELREAGLLYQQQELYYRLEARRLDQEYRRLLEAVVPDWAKIEENRRERVRLPVVDQSQAQEQLAEATRKRLESEIRELRERDGVAAAQQHLGEQIRSRKLRADPEWLQQWLDLCWQAGDWEEAHKVVQRLADLAPDAQTRRNQGLLWRELTDAARAYAEDDIESARSHIESARQMVSDPVLDETEETLEQRTLQRLIASAEQKRRKLKPDDSAERYFEVAHDYGIALQIDPDHHTARSGVAAIGEYLAPVLERRCQDARELRIRKDLKTARTSARRVLNELRALETMADYLQLSNEAKEELEDALATLKKKKELWDEAAERFKQFEEALSLALTNPDPLDDNDPESGGWDFSEARDIIKKLSARAIKERDRDLQQLITTQNNRLDDYEDQVQPVFEHAQELHTAIAQEDFVKVITVTQELEPLWRRMQQVQDWDGLETLIRYFYHYPNVLEVTTLRKHREQAEKQQANARQWAEYEEEISQRYAELTRSEHDLLDDDFKMLKYQMSLHEIQAQCKFWEEQCVDFLRKLAQNPQEAPLSARAEKARRKAEVETRKAHLSDDGGARARIAALKTQAEKTYAEFEKELEKFGRYYEALPPRIKRKRGEIPPQFSKTARKLYTACRELDPLNDGLKSLREQFENSGFTFD